MRAGKNHACIQLAAHLAAQGAHVWLCVPTPNDYPQFSRALVHAQGVDQLTDVQFMVGTGVIDLVSPT